MQDLFIEHGLCAIHLKLHEISLKRSGILHINSSGLDYFIESKMPNKIAEALLRLAPNVVWVTVLMSLFSGIISAFIDNVATVLMLAPIGIAVAKKIDVSPIPVIISICACFRQ